MANCGKCGLPLAFKKLPSGKLCPTNPDGSDHWDLCRLTHLKKTNKRRLDHHCEYMTVPIGKPPVVPDDGLPPWDESLVLDRSWSRGWKSVRIKNPIFKYTMPEDL